MTDNTPLLKPLSSLSIAPHQYIEAEPDTNENLENSLNDELSNTSLYDKINKNMMKNISINIAFMFSWFFFSILLSMYNKWLFSEKHLNFTLPLFAGCVHIVIEYCFSIIIMKLFPQFRPPINSFEMIDNLTKVIPCGVATSLEIGFSNASLKTISLSLYTMYKSSSLGFVLLFSFIFGLEKMHASLIVVIVIIMIGAVMMASTQTEFVFQGFIMVTVASAFGGLKWSLVQILSTRNSVAFNPFSFIYFLSPSIFFCLIILSLLIEGLKNIIYTSFWDYGVNSLIMLIFPGIIAFAMIVSEYWLIKRTSIVTLSVAGICKEVITMGASAIFFKDHLDLINILGFIVTIVGIILYNIMKYYALKEESHIQKLDYKTVPLVNKSRLSTTESPQNTENLAKE
ncbi:hypothetical protein PNEG_01043 [Pneumocystis murina B123]|uniref:Sugar phosphate transporter domain-containing protein n=1 Tax=Pneumocystis murina (strain B123) TaxID=1069680 RepID=M7NUC6_PNEMU|nr:hypothetical protein PNEG_01043 [Pneumocystis murina B123]EMR10897.1 hypothetical protein PNEG_01043 [Pneumocystis murina B123]